MPDRIVIDTNTFLSSAIRDDSTPYFAVARAIATAVVLCSLETWIELEDVLLRTKFERYRAIEVRRRYLEFLREALEQVSVLSHIEVCRHPKDDKFLALAIDGRADLIVTGDNDLLVLNPFRGIEIVTPSAYLSR